MIEKDYSNLQKKWKFENNVQSDQLNIILTKLNIKRKQLMLNRIDEKFSPLKKISKEIENKIKWKTIQKLRVWAAVTHIMNDDGVCNKWHCNSVRLSSLFRSIFFRSFILLDCLTCFGSVFREHKNSGECVTLSIAKRDSVDTEFPKLFSVLLLWLFFMASWCVHFLFYY